MLQKSVEAPSDLGGRVQLLQYEPKELKEEKDPVPRGAEAFMLPADGDGEERDKLPIGSKKRDNRLLRGRARAHAPDTGGTRWHKALKSKED